jgi:hypothetical protein
MKQLQKNMLLITCIPIVPVVVIYWMFSDQNFSEITAVNKGIKLGGPIAVYVLLFYLLRRWSITEFKRIGGKDGVATLGRSGIIQLLLEFNCDAFTKTFSDERSQSDFRQRVKAILDKFENHLGQFPTDLHELVKDIHSSLKQLKSLISKNASIKQWSDEAFVVDSLKFDIVKKVNHILVDQLDHHVRLPERNYYDSKFSNLLNHGLTKDAKIVNQKKKQVLQIAMDNGVDIDVVEKYIQYCNTDKSILLPPKS